MFQRWVLNLIWRSLRFLNIATADLAGNHETDQASIMGSISHVPNFSGMALTTLDDYGFYSEMPASPNWMESLPLIPLCAANVLVVRFLRVRELLVGAWYPLLPPTLDKTLWTGSEYYREDLVKGLFLVFRREIAAITVEISPWTEMTRYELAGEHPQAAESDRKPDGWLRITLAQPRVKVMIVFSVR